jgi:urate oxidase-like protein
MRAVPRLLGSSQMLAVLRFLTVMKFIDRSARVEGGRLMSKFFANLNLVLIVGLALAILIAVFPDSGYRPPTGDLVNGVLQWLHVFFGIVWIGLLYYFNFVQTPAMPTIPAELKPGVSKYIAPKALFFFRWGAAFTVLTGALLAWSYGELVEALTLQPAYRLIGIGMWLALIMAFNVWVIIWPNQKKVLGLVEADDAAKAKAASTAGIASRLNVLLSIPMLLAMTNMH